MVGVPIGTGVQDCAPAASDRFGPHRLASRALGSLIHFLRASPGKADADGMALILREPIMRLFPRRPTFRTLRATLLLGCLLLGTGCAFPASRPFGFFTATNPLLPQTQQMVSAAASPANFPRELNKQIQDPYIVEPGDVLLVTADDLDSPVRLPADQTVLPDGTIQLGRYGSPVVAGRTLKEIEQLVQKTVEAQTAKAGPITVRLVNRVSKVYYVLGEVNAPGSFPLAGRETVLDAILAAGGLKEGVPIGAIVLSRPTPPDGCRVVLPICYQEIVQLGDTATNYQLAPGDRIFVSGRSGFDSLLHPNKQCPPCGGPQSPCLNGSCPAPVGPLPPGAVMPGPSLLGPAVGPPIGVTANKQKVPAVTASRQAR